MKDKKTSTFVWKGLGFPIKLVNTPMIKDIDGWLVDINFNKLHLLAFKELVYKPLSLTGKELRYIRKYQEMTDKQYAKLLGVPLTSVVEWESNQTKIPPALELYVRLHALNHLEATDEDFRTLFNSLSLAQLSKHRRTKMFTIDASKHLKSIPC